MAKKKNWFVRMVLYVYESKRLRSFIWRFAMMGIAGLLAELSGVLSAFAETEPQTIAVVGILGLIFGECSKAISNYYRK